MIADWFEDILPSVSHHSSLFHAFWSGCSAKHTFDVCKWVCDIFFKFLLHILYTVSCGLTTDLSWIHTKPIKHFKCITLNQMEEVRLVCPWGDTWRDNMYKTLHATACVLLGFFPSYSRYINLDCPRKKVLVMFWWITCLLKRLMLCYFRPVQTMLTE